MPRIDPLEAEPGTGLSYTATFDVYPSITLGPIDQLAVSRPVAEVEDADVDGMIETLRKQRREWVPVEREATGTDRVTIDFTGTIDGEAFDGGSGEGFALELDSGRMIPGFAEGLIGVKAGESRELDLQFPSDYHHQDVAGRAVHFAVNTSSVEEPRLPEVDESFAQSFGVGEGGLEGFRGEVRANMTRELGDALRGLTKQRVMDALLAREQVEVPVALLEQEVAQLHEARRQEIRNMGIDPDRVPVDESRLEAEARRRVSLGLLLAELIKANDLRVDAERVRARIDSVASTFEDPDEVVRWYYSDQSRLREVESGVLEEQVVEWILERAAVTEERSSFDAILNAGQAGTGASS